MPYYHIRIKYVSGDKFLHAYEVNLSREEIVKLASQFQKGESIWFDGRTIFPKRVAELKIFETAFHLSYSSEYWHQSYPDGYRGNFGGVEVTRQFIMRPPSIPQEEAESRISTWFKNISFLQLDENWITATIALQLQEVAVTILSKRFGIVLDKQHVEGVLGKKVNGELTFNMKYDAFSKEVEKLCNVKMPIMTKDFRRMRTQILHMGYNPKREETDAIVSFTMGFLQKLERLEPKSM